MLTYEQIELIQNDFLQEAIHSPRLLMDMASMESYLAESYGERILIELLQNADDAQSTKAILLKENGTVIFANNGRPFSADDLMAICRSGASKKDRGTDIGYRGVGFKSTTALTNDIIISSGDAAFEFSKQECAQKLNLKINQVPTVRIPLACDKTNMDDSLLRRIEELHEKGYTTVFIFQNSKADIIDEEIHTFDISSLLFLRNLTELVIEGTEYNARREESDAGLNVFLTMQGYSAQWWLPFGKSDCNFAFKVENGEVVACSPKEAVYHCYLPTLETCPFIFKVNADFSTDPSRKHITLDARTKACLQELVASLITLIQSITDGNVRQKKVLGILTSRNSYNQVASEFYDQFHRQMLKEVSIKLQNGGSVKISEYRVFGNTLSLNEKAYIREKSNYFSAVSSVCDGVSFEQFAECYSKRQFTENDYLALTKDTEFVRECDSRLLAKIYAITAHSFYQLSKFGEEMPSFSDCLIPEAGKVLPIEEQSSTDEEFTETLKNCITKEEWKWFAPLAKTNIEVFEEEKKQPKRAVKAPKATLTKWKSAEQQCADIEKIMGNNASCVGNQNLGYDVVSKTPNGETRYIEVKLLSSDSGTFSLTSNEYATAHQLGESYILCLMVQSETGIAVTYIRNPIETVQLEKRVKQWEWFCSGFDGERQFYPY